MNKREEKLLAEINSVETYSDGEKLMMKAIFEDKIGSKAYLTIMKTLNRRLDNGEICKAN